MPRPFGKPHTMGIGMFVMCGGSFILLHNKRILGKLAEVNIYGETLLSLN